MQKKRGTGDRKNARQARTAHIIAVSAAAVIVLGLLFVLLVLPLLTAHAVLSDALEDAVEAGKTVVLYDPYVKTDLYPETSRVQLEGDDASEVTAFLSTALSSAKYEETDVMLAGALLPYICVRDDASAVYFYLEADSVWVKKNSTYYRFSPNGERGETVYAELYLLVTEYLASETAE